MEPILIDRPPSHASAAGPSLAAGRLARRHGDTQRAIACYREAIRLQPNCIPAFNNLANVLQDEGDLEGALAMARQAIELAPERAILHCNLGSLCWLQGNIDAAISAYGHALALQPNLFLALHNLGKAYAAQGLFKQAEAAYQAALQLKPDQAELHLECGQLFHRYGFVPQAVAHYKAALRLAPFAAAYNALGAALQDWGNIKLAGDSYRRALALKPDFDLPQFNLAQLFENLGDLDQAGQCYRQALANLPEGTPSHAKLLLLLETVRRKQADWADYPARLQALQTAIEQHLQLNKPEPVAVLSALAFPLPPAQFRALAAQQAQQQARLAQALAAPFIHPQQTAPTRLRIGYLSPDLRCHAVGTLVAGLFQHHNRSAFEVFAYSLTPVQDAWTAQVRQGCDHFSDVSHEPPLAIAQRIHADGIHILVDLAGYTAHSRPLVLALRPAPVQIQYLGYPGTMGADFVPYLLADRHLIPEAHAAHYAEQVVYLPQAWGSTPQAFEAVPLTRAECGLPEHGVVFCCFNAAYKIEPEVFALWMSILHQVPGSVLWLLDGGTTGSNHRLRQAAQAAGMAPERLVFDPKRPQAQYPARYPLADLFLDTLAYNAGSTAVWALAAGLPLLTCPGSHYAARMGASLCHAVGLPELVCTSPAAYVAQAVALGHDPARLAQLKAQLQANLPGATLFQPQTFVATLEDAYRQVWHAHTAQAPIDAD